MNNHGSNHGQWRQAAATRAGEGASGESGRDATGHQYGRRIEADRSWTVYHVFTGVPAHAEDRSMIGLSRSDATESMLSLNHRHGGSRKAQATPAAGFRPSPCAVEGYGQ